jgi:NADP-dependent aldehyde dehydrogenase
MTDVLSIDPRTGEAVEAVEAVAPETTPEEVDRLCAAALAAAPGLDALGRAGRAALLRSLADALENRRTTSSPVADREAALGTTPAER